MGVKKLQTFMETCLDPEGFKTVSLSELKGNYEKENPNAPVEILLDVECCLRFIYTSEFRYGGENVTLVELLKNFFYKFNNLGIKIVSFYGNFTNKKKRFEWVRRRYDTFSKIHKLINIMERNQFNNDLNKDDIFVIPPGLCFTSTSIIRNILKEKVIQSLTENDIEIIMYGKKNKSFAILSQDTDFIIANAAQYYLSMKHLDMNTMTTRLYDGKVFAEVHNLKMYQLPLFATLLGTDMMKMETLHSYHNQYFRKNHGKINLKYFFSKIADDCRSINCNENCEPDQIAVARLVRHILRVSPGCYESFEEIQSMIIESVHSFYIYQVEKELYLNMIENDSDRETLKMAILLYRQCWITSDLLMLLCSHTMEMSTCMEIFDWNVKPLGIVLKRLRSVLYAAALNGNCQIAVKEFVVTSKGCFDDNVPTQYPTRIPGVRKLLDIWQCSLLPSLCGPDDVIECYDSQLKLEGILFKRNERGCEKNKEYFVEIFSYSCRISHQFKKTLLCYFKKGLPQAVLIPLFTFIYLDSDRYNFLHICERDAVLFTFTIISILTQTQIKQFHHPRLKITDSIPLMRAANMFRRATQIVINLNAVCGFPISIEWLDGHTYWEGRFVQMFYQFLYNERKTQLALYKIVIEALQMLNDSSSTERFTNLIDIFVDLNLVDTNLKSIKTTSP